MTDSKPLCYFAACQVRGVSQTILSQRTSDNRSADKGCPWVSEKDLFPDYHRPVVLHITLPTILASVLDSFIPSRCDPCRISQVLVKPESLCIFLPRFIISSREIFKSRLVRSWQTCAACISVACIHIPTISPVSYQ